MKLYRGFATVGAMTILSRVLGFVRDVLIAAVLGTSFVADAFFVAFRIPNMFRRLFAEGAFDAAFIPLFARRMHTDGLEAARAFAGQALSGLTFILVVFTILGEIAMPWLMLLLAPGFRDDPEKFTLVVLLARIALPYLVCMSLVALYTGVLNALGRFAIAAFTPSLLNIVLIIVLLGLVASGNEDQGHAGVVLAWGVAVSGLLQILVIAFAAARFGVSVPFERPRLTPEMQRLIALAAPGIVAGGIGQLTGVISTIIATLQDRVVSWLYYADRIFQLPLGVIGVAVGVVLLPDLSHKLRSGDHRAVIASENRALEFALLLTLPAATALLLAATPIMRVLFEHGAFTAADTQATARMLAALALGLPAYVLIKVLHPSFFAREDTKTPMMFAAISMGVECRAELRAVHGDRRHRHRHRHHAVGLAQCRPPRRLPEAEGRVRARCRLSPGAARHPRGDDQHGRGPRADGAGARSLLCGRERNPRAGGSPARPRRWRAPRLSRRRGAVRRRQMAQPAQGYQGLKVWRPAPVSSMLQCSKDEVGALRCRDGRGEARSICRAPTSGRWKRPRPFPPTR